MNSVQSRGSVRAGKNGLHTVGHTDVPGNPRLRVDAAGDRDQSAWVMGPWARAPHPRPSLCSRPPRKLPGSLGTNPQLSGSPRLASAEVPAPPPVLAVSGDGSARRDPWAESAVASWLPRFSVLFLSPQLPLPPTRFSVPVPSDTASPFLSRPPAPLGRDRGRGVPCVRPPRV